MESLEGKQEARSAWRSFGPELLILAGAAVFAVLGRGRWANVTEDHGFWYSAAQSLVSGGRAMHEVRLQWGPMSLWILEGVARVFGMQVSSFVIFQLVIGLLAVLGVQLFVRRFLSPIERWISAAFLVTLILWMVGPGNLLYPCAFAMSHALFLALATLFVCDSGLRRGKWIVASISGVLAGVTFQTKQEFGVVAVLGIASLTLFQPGLAVSLRVRSLAGAALLFLAAYFGVIELARHGEPFRQLAAANILWPWAKIPAPWQGLYRKVLGLDDPRARLIEAGNSLVDLLAVGGTLWALLYAKALRPRARAGLAAALAGLWMVWWWRWTEGSHFRPMTLVLPAIVASVVTVLARRSELLPALPWGEANTFGAFMALALGGLVLLQREGYRGNIEAYYSGMGYVLAVPVAVPLLWGAIRGPRSAGKRSLLAAGLLFVLIARFGIGRLQTLEREWNDTAALTTPRGTVFVTRSLAPVLSSTLQFLATNTSAGDPILMMPQTYGMDFLLDRRSLLYFIWISPGYLTDERELISRLEATPPKTAVIFEGSFGIFHSGQFGHGFADALVAWIETHLPREEKFGGGASLRGRRFLP